LREIKQLARTYLEQGLAVVPVKAKRPLCEWARWQKEPQIEQEFEGLPWADADGFGVLCGLKGKNGQYLAVIDIDRPNFDLKLLRTTAIERTPSGGYHFIYWSKRPVKAIKRTDLGAELLGLGNICIMYPSKGYQKANDNKPTEVENVEVLFHELVVRLGGELDVDEEKLKTEVKTETLQEWLEQIKQRLEVAGEGSNYTYIHCPFHKPDTHPSFVIHKKKYYGYDFHTGKAFSLKVLAKKLGITLDDKYEDVFDEETIAKAKNLLLNPAFLYKLGEVFDQGFVISKINKPRFVVGEERNKRLLGLLLIGASKLGMTSIIKLLGDPGTAKDTLMRMWLDLLNPSIKSVERSYLTAASIRYSKEMKDADLLYIPDSPALSGEMGRQLRFMRSDDGGLISEYAMRDSTSGEMTTKTVRLPVKAVATTSNAITGDTALESGMWILTTNSSEELTKQVKLEKLKFRAGKRLLLSEEKLKLWKCAFHILLTQEPLEELPKIPYAEQLIKLLESPRSESRRDPDKLCDLISLIAWVRRFQKPPEKHGKADLIDLYYALQLGWDAITETISELNSREQAIYRTIKNAITTDDATVKYVANTTGIPYKTCYAYLEKLVLKGYLVRDKKQGRNVYSTLQEKEPKSLISIADINASNSKHLMGFILSLFNDFSSSIQGIEGYNIVDPLSGEIIHITVNNGHVNVAVEQARLLHPTEKGRSLEIRQENTSDLKKKNLKLISRSNISNSRFSDAKLFKCDLCTKPVYFATQADLEHHVRTNHSKNDGIQLIVGQVASITKNKSEENEIQPKHKKRIPDLTVLNR